MLPLLTRRGTTMLLAGVCWPALANAGDFNNDGFDDLVLGVPGETVGNVRGGAIHVLYGTANGITAGTPPDQIFHQGSVNVPDTVEDGDEFGHAVCTGDFNGDGFDDVAIGAPEEDLVSGGQNRFGAGLVTIIFGSASGLSTTARLPQSFRAAAVVAGASFGVALASDDFNDDGRDDLAIGVPDDQVGTVFRAGTVQVLFGTANGLTTAGRQVLSQNSAGVEDTAEAVDNFGFSLAASDFNGDNVGDLAIGVPFENLNASDSGMVHVLLGFPGFGVGGNDITFAQGVNGVPGTAGSGDTFGFALAACPRAKSGLAIGCPADNDSPLRSGSVLMLPALGLSVANSTFISQNLIAGFAAPTSSDRFGASLVVNDFGRIFFPSGSAFDLAIGAPGATGLNGFTPVPGAGVVFVLYGRENTLLFNTLQRFCQGNNGLGESAEDGDGFGAAMNAGNFGSDLAADLVVGTPREDSGLVDTGVAQVIYGRVSSGLGTTDDQVWTQDTNGVLDLSETGDRFGASASGR